MQLILTIAAKKSRIAEKIPALATRTIDSKEGGGDERAEEYSRQHKVHMCSSRVKDKPISPALAPMRK